MNFVPRRARMCLDVLGCGLCAQTKNEIFSSHFARKLCESEVESECGCECLL